jgi:glycosyltransferase involved in cell wall biosynthesis
VLIEALYLGTPIVATDCPGGSREILKNGEYGRLVPVDSDQMLADAITTSLNCHFLCPPSESWTPYTLDFVVDRYLKLLVQAKHA